MTVTDIHPKVAASSGAGALTIVLIWVLGLFNVTMPAEVGSAITLMLMSVAGYVKKPAP